MKKIVLSLCISLVAATGFAQEESNGFGGFGGPLFQVGSVNGQTSLIIGGGGGFIFKYHYFIGGYGEGMVTPNSTEKVGLTNHSFNLSHGGPWFGYIAKFNKNNGMFLSAKLGWGSATLIEDAAVSYINRYFVVNPSVEYERIFTPYFKIGVGVAWPFYNGIDNPAYNDKDVSNPAAFISIRLGYF